MKTQAKRALMLGCGLAIVGAAAHAQTTPVSDTAVSELVVTTSKRAEPLQQVPEAATVVGPQVLAQDNINNAVG